MNYENECKTAAGAGSLLGQNRVVEFNPTVGENLDRQIAECEDRLAKLKASKHSLEPLLDMKIGDLRQAMMY